VCKKFFLDTLNVSVGRLDRALHASVPGTDLRGKMTGSSRKTNEEAIIVVKEHIQNVTAFESHYTRSHSPGRKYLNPDLDEIKMFNLYVENVKKITYPMLMNGYIEKFLMRNSICIFTIHAKTHARNVIAESEN
jgi:hypothetical protein